MPAVLMLFLPLVASYGIIAMIGLQVVIGLLIGISFPAIFDILKHWVPPAERSTLVSVVVSGMHVGTITGTMLSGIIAESFGWRSNFYVFGKFSKNHTPEK